MKTLWAGVAGLVVAGCLAPVRPPDRPWLETTSDHFVVQSDLDAERAQQAVRDFERWYGALGTFLVANGDELPGKTHVVLLEKFVDYETVSRRGAAGDFRWNSSLIDPFRTIVLPARTERVTAEVFRHELTHRFMSHHFPSAPAWVQEGLAEFLSTLTTKGNGAVVGMPPVDHWFNRRHWKIGNRRLDEVAPDFSDVRSKPLEWFQQAPLEAYSGSWALVHVLLEGEADDRRAFEAYLHELRTAHATEPELFARHFDAAQLGRIERAYEAFLIRGAQTKTEVVALSPSPEVKLEQTPLTRSAAHVLWGRLLMTRTPAALEAALREAERAIELDPHSPDAHLLRGLLQHKLASSGAEADLRRAVALKPTEPRFIRALATLLLVEQKSPVERDALAKKLLPFARSAEDWAFLALWHLEKEPEQAFLWANKAASADASCITCFEALALAAFRAGKLATAVVSQQRAIAIAGERGSPESLATLAFYQRAAASPAAFRAQPSRAE